MGAVLGNVLPGLRQIRAPLAGGFLWLFALWIAFFHQSRLDHSSTGLGGDLYALAQPFGTGVTLTVATFAAYLVGTLAQPFNSAFSVPYILGTRLWTRLTGDRSGSGRPRPRALLDGPPLPTLRDNGRFGDDRFVELSRLLVERLLSRFNSDGEARIAAVDRLRELSELRPRFRLEYDTAYGGYWGDVSVDEAKEALTMEGESPRLRDVRGAVRLGMILLLVNVEEYWGRLLQDFVRTVPQRLLGKEPEIYANFDRYIAEAEFRRAIAAPLYVLSGALAFEVSFWWFFGWIACLALTGLAQRSERDAYVQLTASLEAKRVESPILAEVNDSPLVWRDPDAVMEVVSY